MKKRTTWTPLMDEYLFKKRMKGESFTSIASSLGVTRRAAHVRFRRVFGDKLPPGMTRRVSKHSWQTKAAVVEMKQGGKRLKEIAAELGLNTNQVHGIWWYWRQHHTAVQEAA